MRTFLLERAPAVRRYILLALVAGVPVLFLRTGRDPFNVPKLALLTSGVALAGALRSAEALQGRALKPLNRLWIPAVAIAGPLLLAWIFTPYKWWSLLGKYGRFQGLLPYLLVIALGLLLVDAFHGHARQLAWALVAAGGVVGFYGIVQFVGADPFTWAFPDRTTDQALSTLGNSNFAGGFLGITFPVALGLAVGEERLRGRAIRLGILILGGLLVSKSEGGWAAGFAGAATLAGFLMAWRWRQARMLGAIAVVIATGALLAVGAYTIVRPENTIVPQTLKLRAWWWQEAASMTMDAPIVGHGPNSFAVEVWQYRVDPEAEATHYAAADDPHSVPLSFLAAAGLVGLAGFLTVFCWVAWQAYNLRDPDRLTAAFLGGIVAYFVQSFVTIDELSLRLALWTVLAGFVVSKLQSAEAATTKPKKKKSSTTRVAPAPLKAPISIALLALIPLGSIAWSVGLLVADNHYLRGEQLFLSGEPDEARAHFERALAFRDEYDMRHIYGFRIGDAGVLLKREEYIDEARETFAYLSDFPDVAALRDYARVMRQWSGIEPSASAEAESLYARAAELDPENPALREEAANVLEG